MPLTARASRARDHVAIVFDDITERKRAEALQTFLLTLSDALRPLSDPVVIQETAMQVLGAHLGVNRAFYGELADDGDTLYIGPGYANEVAPIERYVQFTAFDSDLLTDYRAGKTVVINDLYADVKLSPEAKAAFDSIQVRCRWSRTCERNAGAHNPEYSPVRAAHLDGKRNHHG